MSLIEGLEEGFMNDGDGAPEEEAQAATTSRVRKGKVRSRILVWPLKNAKDVT